MARCEWRDSFSHPDVVLQDQCVLEEHDATTRHALPVLEEGEPVVDASTSPLVTPEEEQKYREIHRKAMRGRNCFVAACHIAQALGFGAAVRCTNEDLARLAWDAAEALVAEGERRGKLRFDYGGGPLV